MKLYLCGPMTGRPNLNREAFHKAAIELQAAGYETVNPHSLQIGYEDQSWIACMRRDVKALVDCDGVAIIDRAWSHSKGCVVELGLAYGLGIKTNFLHAWVYEAERAAA